MTLLYNFGLTTGSLMAYMLESMLGPVDERHCIPNPIQVKFPEYAVNSTSSITLATTPITTIVTSIATSLSSFTVNSTLDAER